MAKDKELQIVLGLNTNAFQKSMNDVLKSSNQLSKEINAVNKSLKFDPTNTELLAQKQQLLAEKVKDSQESLEKLKNIQETMKAQGIDESDKSYRSLTRSISFTEGELQRAKQAQEEFNKEASKVERIQEKIRSLGSACENLGNKLKGVSVVGAGVVAGISAMSVKAVKASDDLNTMAKVTGLTTEEIQKIKFASDIVDVSFEDVSKAMGKLNKSMGDAQKGSATTSQAFEKLGVSITNSDGSLRDKNEVFKEAINALHNMENEAERNALAMDIFGKSAMNLNPLILDGADAFTKLADEAGAFVIDQEQLDSLNELNDKLDISKAKMQGAFGKLGSQFAQDFAPIFDVISEGASKISQIFGNLPKPVRMLIATLGGIAGGLAPALIMAGKIATAIGSLKPVFLAIKTAVLGVTGALSAPVAIIAGIVALIAVLYAKCEWFRNAVNSIVGFIVNLIGSAINMIVGVVSSAFNMIWGIISGILGDNGIGGGVKGLVSVFSSVFNSIVSVVTNCWNGILSLFSAGGQIFLGVVDGIANIFKTIVNALIDGINRVIAIPLDGINSVLNGIKGINILGVEPFGWIPNIPVPQFPKLNVGTDLVKSEGLAYIHQKEAVVTANTNSKYDRIADKLENLTGNQKIEISLLLDKDVLAKKLVTPISYLQSKGLRTV